MPIQPPLTSFVSPGGRTFTVEPGEHWERFPDDNLWHDGFPILFEGKPAGKLYRSESYGRTAKGDPRWQASTRDLFWTADVRDAPTGIGFDVAAFDTAEACLVAWGRSADQILDYAEGKPVVTSYVKGGIAQKKPK